MSLISRTPEAGRGLVNGGLPAKISIARLVLSPERLGGMFYLPLPPTTQPRCPVTPATFCHHLSLMGCSQLTEGTEGGKRLMAISEHLSCTRLWARHWERSSKGSEKFRI